MAFDPVTGGLAIGEVVIKAGVSVLDWSKAALDVVGNALGVSDSFIKLGTMALQHYDNRFKTRYVDEYRDHLKVIIEEESKPVVGNLRDKDLRDQNKIDRAKLEIDTLLRYYINEKDKH